ncbi:hypothetical protein C8R43DRAFT_1142938 [Mycena crocata]|nr:hypothetical protein C8R43DRAFT_1142938 [Mycena crocata]
MSHQFWAEAAMAHCYVCGFIPSSRHPDVIPWVAWFCQTNAAGELVKLNVSHLCVWGSRCWVKDLDYVEGKLGKQGWEGQMVGYMGHRGYRVYNTKRAWIFQVRNIIFEEGEPHRTHPVDPEHHDEPFPHDLSIFEDDMPVIPQAPAPPAPIPVPSASIPAPPAPPIIPDPLCRTGRVLKPTHAILEMEMFHREEEQAKLAGEDWAHDDLWPTANAVDIDWSGFDDALLSSPWAFASSVKGMIPRSYREVMRDAEKWGPAMQAEFDQLEAHTQRLEAR